MSAAHPRRSVAATTWAGDGQRPRGEPVARERRVHRALEHPLHHHEPADDDERLLEAPPCDPRALPEHDEERDEPPPRPEQGEAPLHEEVEAVLHRDRRGRAELDREEPEVAEHRFVTHRTPRSAGAPRARRGGPPPRALRRRPTGWRARAARPPAGSARSPSRPGTRACTGTAGSAPSPRASAGTARAARGSRRTRRTGRARPRTARRTTRPRRRARR